LAEKERKVVVGLERLKNKLAPTTGWVQVVSNCKQFIASLLLYFQNTYLNLDFTLKKHSLRALEWDKANF